MSKITVETRPEFIWQRREIDIPADTDYTQNELGVEAIMATKTIEKCPACARPGVRFSVQAPWGVGTLICHRRNQASDDITEACMTVPPEEPTLVLLDKEGNETYRGTPSGASGN